MGSDRKFIVAGNWKMNGTIKTVSDLLDGLKSADVDPNVKVIISPPALYLTLARERLPSHVAVAAQNVFNKPNGAFTGEISVEQLKDAGVEWAILGHSERRTMQEEDKFVGSKAKAAIDGGLGAIVCCGESLEQREKDETVKVVTTQLQAVADAVGKEWEKIVIAYEPIWAIGTGKVASTQQAQEAHAAIRSWLSEAISEKAANETRILYGGSVTDKNCKDLSKQRDIDGFLVGGASLKPAFFDIINVKK